MLTDWCVQPRVHAVLRAHPEALGARVEPAWLPSRPLPGSLGMPKAGAINGDNPIPLRKLVEQPADHKILCHRAVAVEQDHGSAFATRDVVDALAVNLDEPVWSALERLGCR